MELYSNAEPCISLVPLLVCTLTAAPPASPCSASKLLVTTFTVSIDSSAGMYDVMCGGQTFVPVTPSMRGLLELLLAPLTLNVRARDGFEGIEWVLPGGLQPGSVLNSC